MAKLDFGIQISHCKQHRQAYGLIVHDGGSSTIEMSFCPWCGKKL
ncbi:hypothetical protein PV791_04820 [Priestia filamentosa]